MTFIPTFADLARNAASVEGTGEVTLGAAIAGFTGIGDALSPGDQFYYTLQSIDLPGEIEVGRGTLVDEVTVARGPVSGTAVDFSAGSKTISLVAAAEWHAKVEARTTIADRAEVRMGTEAEHPVTPAALFAAAEPVTLAYSPSIYPDFAAGINFDLDLHGDAVLESPLNAKPGQSGRIRVAQDSLGGRSLDFGPTWQFAGGRPTLTSIPSAVDLIAYFVARDGAIEASLLPAVDARPVPISDADFVNGVYSLNGQSCALDDLWVPRSPETFQPGSIIPGVGWQTSGTTTITNALVATADHELQLPKASGLTFVMDYSLTQPAGTKPRISLAMPDQDYSYCWGFYQNGTSYINLYDYGVVDFREVPGPMGDSRVAATLAPDGLSYSRNGAAVQNGGVSQDLVFGPAVPIEIAAYVSHDSTGEPAVATLRRLTIYRKVGPGLLTVLSV